MPAEDTSSAEGFPRERHCDGEGIRIVNFEFSKVFNDAIEAKVTAERQALAAKNKLGGTVPFMNVPRE